MTTIKSDSVFQFNVTLQEVTPPIWRRIHVSPHNTFAQFHSILQDAMGWEDRHLYEFTIKYPDCEPAVQIGIPDEEWGDEEVIDARTVILRDYFKTVPTKARYEYDFGDGWVHLIQLEAILPKEIAAPPPRCLAGKRACPPEDCGGPFGYERLLDGLNNPQHPDYQYLSTHVGEAFEPEAFVPEGVRFRRGK